LTTCFAFSAGLLRIAVVTAGAGDPTSVAVITSRGLRGCARRSKAFLNALIQAFFSFEENVRKLFVYVLSEKMQNTSTRDNEPVFFQLCLAIFARLLNR
jgi:hypothetical protein